MRKTFDAYGSVKRRILIVDDHAPIRTTFERALTSDEWQVKTASSGTNALSLIEVLEFDLIFLDMRMPDMDGLEVLRRLRARGISVPVVLVTAYTHQLSEHEVRAEGGDGFFKKPISPQELRRVTGTFLNFGSESSGRH